MMRRLISVTLIAAVCALNVVFLAGDIDFFYVQNGLHVCMSDYLMISTAPAYADLRVFIPFLIILVLEEKNRQTYVFVYRYSSRKRLAGHILRRSLCRAVFCSVAWTAAAGIGGALRNLPVMNWSESGSVYAGLVRSTLSSGGIVPVVVFLCVWIGVSKLLLYELFYEILFRVTRYTALVWVPAGVNAGIGYMMYLAKRHWFYILYEKSFWVSAFWQYLFLSAVCVALYGILYAVICKGDVCK
jgi:hypothetical protein